MALSGAIQSGAGYGGSYLRIEWSATQNVGANYSDVTAREYLVLPNSTTLNATESGDVNIAGQPFGYSNGTTYRSTGSHLIKSATKRVYHNADGTKSFSLGGHFQSGWSTFGRIDTGMQTQVLNTIPRASTPTLSDTTPNSDQTITIHTNRASSSFTHSILLDFGGYDVTLATGVTSSWSWNLLNNKAGMAAQIPNSKTGSGTIRLRTYSGSTFVGEKTIGFTYTLISAEPTFSNYQTYDANATTVGVTGNSSVIVQNYSNVKTRITSANKMVARYSSSAVRYESTLSGRTVSANYSSSSDVLISHGAIQASSSLTQSIKAVDSRGYTKTVNKTIPVVPYKKPILNVGITRLNNFENETTLKVSGSFSQMFVSGVRRNGLLSTAVSYRKKVQGASWSSWITLTISAYNGDAGTFACADVIASYDNSKYVDFEVRVSDKLTTTIHSTRVSAGKPILYVDTKNGSVGVGKMSDKVNVLDVDGAIYSEGRKVLTDFGNRLLPPGNYEDANFWRSLETGLYWHNHNNYTTESNAPSSYALVEVLKYGGETQVVWRTQSHGKHFVGSCNGSGGWHGWYEIQDNPYADPTSIHRDVTGIISDFNHSDLLKGGRYRITSYAWGNSMSNRPSKWGCAGWLETKTLHPGRYPYAGSNYNYCNQRFESLDGGIAIRNVYTDSNGTQVFRSWKYWDD